MILFILQTTPLNKGIINSQTTIARGPPLLASSLDGGRGFVGKAIRGEVTTSKPLNLIYLSHNLKSINIFINRCFFFFNSFGQGKVQG